LRAEELSGLSRIQQELERNRDGFNDLEDQANAIRQEDELRKSIELRRQALLAAASAAQTSAVKELLDAKELVGVYGRQRDIILEQQKIRRARTDADDAQGALNRARANGADPKEVEAAEKLVNAAITRRVQTEITGAERISRLNAEGAARSQLDATQNALALQAVQQRIAVATQLAGVEQGIVRSTLEQVLNIQAGVAAAKRREQELGAQITAARQVGDESGASRLVGEQKVAAQQTKLAIIEGATALRDAGKQLAKDAEATRNQLQNLRISNFQFLSPQEQKRAYDRAFAAADNEARRAGVVFTATGTLEERTALLQGFADFRKQERQLIDQSKAISEAITTGNTALVEANQALNTSIGNLNEVVDALTAKNWSVNVDVYADGSSQAYGDVVNGAVSQ
jgi:hypothetical protein